LKICPLLFAPTPPILPLWWPEQSCIKNVYRVNSPRMTLSEPASWDLIHPVSNCR